MKARLGWKGLTAEEYVSDGFIFLATPNLKGPRIDFFDVNYISEWRYHESPEIQLSVGDVLLVKDGSTLGTANLVRHLPRPATVNGSIAVLRPTSDLDSHYLHQYVLGRDFQKLVRIKKGGLGVPHLFQADLREFVLRLPPLPEQRRIAEILDTVDDAIRKTEEIIAKLQQVKQGLLHDLLTRGIDDNGELRDPVRRPEQFKDSPLGRIPKEWMCSTVKETFDVTSGVTLGPHRRPQHHPWPYLRVANVHRDRLELKDVAELEATPSELADKKLLHGDLLVVEGHANPAEIGRCAMATTDVEGFTFQNHLFRLQSRGLVPDFSLLWMNSRWAQAYWLCEAATSSGLNTINRRKLSRMGVAVPSQAEQHRIVACVAAARNRLNTEEEEVEKLRTLKAGLMDDLLTGRVRVTPLLEKAIP